MPKNLILAMAVFVLLVSPVSQAQMIPMPKEGHVSMWNAMQGMDRLTVSEITRDGKFSACEMVFQYSIRDTRSLGGEPLLVHDSVSYWSFPKKLPVLSIKIQPTRFMTDSRSKEVKQVFVTPASASFKLGQYEIKDFEGTRFECEGKGSCIGYGETKSDMRLANLVSQVIPFDGTLRFSLVKDGMDLSARLSDFKLANGSTEAVLMEFSKCIPKVLQATIEGLK